VILSLTQLYRYTPEIFLFSTATFKYTYRTPLRRIGQEYSANVAGGLLVLEFECITRPVVSASTLTWFIRYIYYWNVQLLYNVIINKTKVLLPRAYVSFVDVGPLDPLVLLLPAKPFFKVNICPFPLPHFASIFFAYL
jgi:hypothetical protein